MSSKLPKLTWSTEVREHFEYAAPKAGSDAKAAEVAKDRKTKAFDRKACLKKFAKKRDLVPTKPTAMTAEEQRFWFWALTDVREDLDAVRSMLLDKDVDAPVTFDMAKSRVDAFIGSYHYWTPSLYELAPLLAAMFSWSEALQLAMGARSYELESFLQFLPAVSPDEHEEASAHVVRYLESRTDDQVTERATGELLLHFPHPETAERYIAGARRWYLPSEPLAIFLQLADPSAAYKALRRLDVKVDLPDVARLLEVFGFEAVDQLVISAAKGYLEHALKIRSSRAVAGWLDLAGKPKTTDMAHHWLVNEGANAIDGMLDFLARRGKKHDLAVAALSRVVANGHEDIVQQLAATKPPKVLQALQSEVLGSESGPEPLPKAQWMPWMHECAAAKKSARLASLLGPASLRPVMVAGSNYRVPDDVLAGFLSLVADQKTTPSVRDDLDPHSAGALAWDLIIRWKVANGSKSTWPFQVMAKLGGPDEATKFGRMARSQTFDAHKPASHALLAMGSPEALTALVRAYDSGRGQLFNRKAFERLMADRGFAGDEDGFRDSIIPSCGLSDLHVIELDFGARVFTLALTPPSRIVIVDLDSGEVFQKFPPRRKADDAHKHKAATERYKVFKEDLKEVVAQEAYRLLNGMLTGRQWTREAWLRDISHHPVMGPLACTLVWRTTLHGETITFMPTHPDDSCIRNNYDETAIGETISVFYPADAPREITEAWRQVLTDSEIVQPFEQLSRPTYRLASAESEALIKRIVDHAWTDDGLADGVRSAGFYTGETNDNNDWLWVEREVGQWKVRLTFKKPVPRWAWPPSDPTFGIESIKFLRDGTEDDASIPSAVFSEVMRDLLQLFEHT